MGRKGERALFLAISLKFSVLDFSALPKETKNEGGELYGPSAASKLVSFIAKSKVVPRFHIFTRRYPQRFLRVRPQLLGVRLNHHPNPDLL